MKIRSFNKVVAVCLLTLVGLSFVRPAFAGYKDWSIYRYTLGGELGVNGYDAYSNIADSAAEIIEGAKKGGVLGGIVVVSAWLIEHAAKTDPFGADSVKEVGPVIRAAGSFIVGLINIFYILVLLFIAISTILGVERYNIQTLLPRLVIAILLTNFGIFFVFAIAQVSHLLALGLLGPHIGTDIINATNIEGNLLRTSTKTALAVGGILTISTAGLGAAFLPIIAVLAVLLDPLFWFAALLVMTALILVFRIAGLWLLAIFAPAGVAAGVLPSTQRFAALYWQKVLAYAFIGPVLIFFIRLAVIIYGATATSNSSRIGTLFGYLVTAFTLLAGIMVARKMGVEIANFIIGAFEKGIKGVIGATVGYSKLLYTLGKTGIQLAATGGTSLGAKYAASKSWDTATAQSVGKAAGVFSGNLKDQFGGKGVMGSVGKFFGNRAKELKDYKPKEEKPAWQNDADAASAETRKAAEEREKILKGEPGIAEDLKVPADYANRMNAAMSQAEKAGLALAFASKGGIHSKNFTDRTRGITNPQLLDQIRRQAAVKGDIRLAFPDWDLPSTTDTQRVDMVKGWMKSNPIEYQRVALQDQRVAEAVLSGKQGKDYDKLVRVLDKDQRNSLAVGVAKAADGKAATDPLQRQYVLRAAELGFDPSVLYQRGAFRSMGTAVQANVKSSINNDAKYYVNQNPNAAIKMFGQITNPAKALSVFNSKDLPNNIRAGIAAEIGNAISPIKRDMQRVLKGNMKIAQERAAISMERMIGELKGEVGKAREAAEKAGTPP